MTSWRQTHSHDQAGFSLIEALIALVVLSVGLLGVAALQTQALLQSRDAYLTSQATSLVQDMADRIRANADAMSDYEHTAGSSPPSGNSLADNDVKDWLADLTTTLPQGQANIVVNGREADITVTWQETEEDTNRSTNIVTEIP